jgi:hypothetical protein
MARHLVSSELVILVCFTTMQPGHSALPFVSTVLLTAPGAHLWIASGDTRPAVELQAAHDFGVELDGSAQLPNFFAEGVTLLKEGSDVERQSVFERGAISWGS